MPSNTLRRMIYSAVCALVVLFLPILTAGQEKGAAVSPTPASAASANRPAVTQIDIAGLKKALTSAGKPLLVNFWATWCDPCREEFPDLVNLDAEYKGKIDFITISLDEVKEINRDVPKFLSEMKAEMPAYLLKAEDDDAAIAAISKNFTGALPFTILFDSSGKETYVRQGKVKLETVREEIDKLLMPTISSTGR
jgi:thiol-disulfide isomerase/thioredoxin